MKLGYTVSKEKGGQWYCHQVGFPYVPVFGSFGDKKKHCMLQQKCVVFHTKNTCS